MSHEGKGFDENWVRICHRNRPRCKIMKRPTLQILESKWREILTRQLSLSILQVWFESIQSLALLCLALMVSRCDTEKYTKMKPVAALSSTSGSNFTASLSAPRPPAISRRASVPRVVGKSNKESLLISLYSIYEVLWGYVRITPARKERVQPQLHESLWCECNPPANHVVGTFGFRSFRFQFTASGHFVVHSCLGFKGPKALESSFSSRAIRTLCSQTTIYSLAKPSNDATTPGVCTVRPVRACGNFVRSNTVRWSNCFPLTLLRICRAFKKLGVSMDINLVQNDLLDMFDLQ